DAVGHGNGVEDHRLAAGFVDPSRGPARQLVDMDVARRHLAPGGADADLRLLKILAGESDGVEHGASGRARGAVEHTGRMRAARHVCDRITAGTTFDARQRTT